MSCGRWDRWGHDGGDNWRQDLRTFLPQSESEDWQRILKSDSGLSQVSGKQQQPNMLATVWKHLQINESVTFHINDSTNFWIPVCVEGPKPSLYFSDPANKRWGKTSCSLVQSPAQSGWSHLNSQFHLSSTWFHINYNKNVAQASSQIIRSSDLQTPTSYWTRIQITSKRSKTGGTVWCKRRMCRAVNNKQKQR